ncbi:hypothetical protein LF41_1669 [Lysobacter dokdonensis DS-58]|uniref:Uncharacterized protein n=1 Tax=Lysobacter dokdonensis DS-58 TaxID=1300345 RepID=A0A0A2WZ93_9GAMM|nr:hypothetical protein LF41_1669 [Lysobacter dokdonensis DS-58]
MVGFVAHPGGRDGGAERSGGRRQFRREQRRIGRRGEGKRIHRARV